MILLEDLPGLSKEYYNNRDSSHQHSPLAMFLVFTYQLAHKLCLDDLSWVHPAASSKLT